MDFRSNPVFIIQGNQLNNHIHHNDQQLELDLLFQSKSFQEPYEEKKEREGEKKEKTKKVR